MRHERFVQVDKKQVNTMNLQVLQRMDPEIEEVLRAVSHVALYQLDVKKMEWVRAGCTISPLPHVHTGTVRDPSVCAALRAHRRALAAQMARARVSSRVSENPPVCVAGIAPCPVHADIVHGPSACPVVGTGGTVQAQMARLGNAWAGWAGRSGCTEESRVCGGTDRTRWWLSGCDGSRCHAGWQWPPLSTHRRTGTWRMVH